MDKVKRVALVTGASKGIGVAIAQQLLEVGTNVYICSRSQQNLNNAKNQLQGILASVENVGQLHVVCCDVTDKPSVLALIDDIEQRYGYLNVLINNSGGLSQTGTFNDLSTKDWLDCINSNLLSTVTISQACYPLLKRASNAKVIQISSITAIQPGLFNPHYAAAKAGLLALSKNLSMLWAPDGILVNSVSPGIIATEGWRQYIAQKASDSGRSIDDVTREESTRASANVPLNRLGTADEVAKCVLFLASDDNTFITGENIIIDGGKFRAI